MSVKVTKHGSEDFTPFSCVCGNCQATLSVGEFSDMLEGMFESGMDESGNGSRELYVRCPDCKNCVILPKEIQTLYKRKVLALKGK